MAEESREILWSICVPSVPSRRLVRNAVLEELDRQIADRDDIEVLLLEDNWKRDYGPKLQTFVDIAQGEYISFIDDDDMVHWDYVSSISEILETGVDAVSFFGHIEFEDGVIAYVQYLPCTAPINEDFVYLRPLQHVSPIRTSIVKTIPYEGHWGADTVWSMKLAASGLVKSYGVVNPSTPMYFYRPKLNDPDGHWRLPEPEVPDVELE